MVKSLVLVLRGSSKRKQGVGLFYAAKIREV